MPLNLQDAQLIATGALPASASSSVLICSIDTQDSAFADFVARCEFLLNSPALTTTMLPDTRTLTYDLVMADSADLTSNTVTLSTSILTQTGAGGAGAAAATVRARPPVSNLKRYIGVRANAGGSTTNMSTKSASLSLVT